jgi:hypothetical protein
MDYSVVVIPSGNVGAKVSVTPTPTESRGRYGVGLVWGELNKATDLAGLTGGASVTLDIGRGINVNGMLVDNPAIPGAINNTVVLFGVESAQFASRTGAPLPLIRMNANSHLNMSWIFSINSLITGVHNGVLAGAAKLGMTAGPTR